MGSNQLGIGRICLGSNFTAEKIYYLNSITYWAEMHSKNPWDFELTQYIKNHPNLI